MILLTAVMTISIILAYAVASAIYEAGKHMDDE